MRKEITIGAVGAGGDGVIVLGNILQELAGNQGYFGITSRAYGAQIRGGGSSIKTKIDSEHLSLAEDFLDVLICFNWQKYFEFERELRIGEKTIIFCEADPPSSVQSGKFFRVSFGNGQNKNIVALGFLKNMIGLSDPDPRNPSQRILKNNLPSFMAGEKLFQEGNFSKLELERPRNPVPKITIQGNEAVSRAIIDSGCRFGTGYPITPSTEIMEFLRKKLPQLGGQFIQGASENEAIYILYGASLAGKKVVVPTSLPGLSRMMEAIGLFSATEVPLVIIDVQRCGPSTGIPTKTEQADLQTVIYGSGDASRVVLAPFDFESCYQITAQAFNIAEQFQLPVIVLSDQWLGQTVASCNDFTLIKPEIISRLKPGENEKNNYLRYRLSENNISPMASFGDEGFVYQTTGLTHDERGRPASSQYLQQKMHEKIWKKLEPLKQRDDLVKVFGNPEAEIGIITWGSSGMFVRDTVRKMGMEEYIKVCVPELIFPLPEKSIARFLKGVKKSLVVEMNYTGQFYHFLRSRLNLPRKTKLYCRAGGSPFTNEELSQAIEEAIR
ncbi:MAG: 2-oxoacid:acceptor oxidoreductase family protein [Candidatus Nealsonbacteria bacterium]|nr:2-oxoacid:acceptor oxidoreductase family protein [Candidatus Nealsonbacteria bacterium]